MYERAAGHLEEAHKALQQIPCLSVRLVHVDASVMVSQSGKLGFHKLFL